MQCTECQSWDIIEDAQSADTICTSCGLVLDSHAYATPPIHEGAVMEDLLGHQTISNCPTNLKHLGCDSQQRTLVISAYNVATVASRICLSDNLILLSQQLWKQVCEARVFRGELRKGMMAACIYMACKLGGFSRPKSTVADACETSTGATSKALKLYFKLQGEQVHSAALDSADVLAQVSRSLCSLLQPYDPRKVLAQARLIDHNICTSGVLEGKTPRVRASAALYMTLEKLGASCEGFAAAVGISQHTLSRTLTVIRTHKSHLESED